LSNGFNGNSLILHGANVIKRTKGDKLKSFSRTTFDKWHSIVGSIVINFVFFIPNLPLYDKYNNFLTTFLTYIMYIMHSCIWAKFVQFFCKNEFSSFNWQGIKMFEKIKFNVKGLNFFNMQINFWSASNFEHWNFASNGAYSKNIHWKLKFLPSPCHVSNIQKQNFKECPPT